MLDNILKPENGSCPELSSAVAQSCCKQQQDLLKQMKKEPKSYLTSSFTATLINPNQNPSLITNISSVNNTSSENLVQRGK